MKIGTCRWVGILFCALLTAAPVPAKGAWPTASRPEAMNPLTLHSPFFSIPSERKWPVTQWEKGSRGVEMPYESADSISPNAAGAMATEGRRSPGRAFLYSFLGTAIPVGVGGGAALGNNELSAGALVAIGGAIVGPSLGHFYAQRHGRAIGGIVARGVAAGMITGAVYSSNLSVASALFYGGSALGIVFFVTDIAGAPHSAHVHNETVAGRVRIGVASMVSPITGAPGVGVRLVD